MSAGDNFGVLGADGTPHLTLYDKENGLSFAYDEFAHRSTVGVAHGGYAEPVFDTFIIDLSGERTVSNHFIAFQNACWTYSRAWEARRRKAVEWGESEPTADEIE